MPNESIRQRNKQTVLTQAMELFADNGVENTSVEMIARKSGLSLRSVQNYYRTKNELIAAVLRSGYAAEQAELQSFFASAQYQSKTGAEQLQAIVAAALGRAVEQPALIFCTAQMQRILSRVPDWDEKPPLCGNWPAVMEQLKSAFDKGVRDGSITQTVQENLIDARSVMLAMRGIQEQVAFAMCDGELNALLEPKIAAKKYLRQMEMMLSAGRDG